MPFVSDRWLGGMMTNFSTIRKSVRKMQNIERMLNDGTLENITKKERLVLSRKYEKTTSYVRRYFTAQQTAKYTACLLTLATNILQLPKLLD